MAEQEAAPAGPAETAPAAQAEAPATEQVTLSRAQLDEYKRAMQQVEHVRTPEGYKQLVQAIVQRHGPDIAKTVLKGASADEVFKGLDSAERRRIRRAVARQGETDPSQLQDDMHDTDPTADPAEEARSAEQALRKEMAELKAGLTSVVEMQQLRSPLERVRATNPAAQRHPEEHDAAVVALLKSNDPRYLGPQGISNASADVLAGWRKFGEMAGLTAPAAAVPGPGGGIPSVSQSDIETRLAAARKAGGKNAMLKALEAMGLHGS